MEFDPKWMYMSPEGDEYGPYSNSEVRLYMAEGRIIPEGSLRDVGGDLGWRRASEVLDEQGLWVPPTTVRSSAVAKPLEPRVPAIARPTEAYSSGISSVSTMAYILLGVLPGIPGVFGIHNLVAGYTAKGVVQLVCGIVFIWLGMCFGGLLGCFPWLGLMIWTIVEVCTVRVDARGQRFRA